MSAFLISLRRVRFDEGDYILLLPRVRAVEYDTARYKLTGSDGELAATLLASIRGLGRLFRVEGGM